MSTIRAEVVKIENVRPHPNADSLDLCEILGWQVVIGKGRYTDGSKVVYFEQGTTLPQSLTDRLGVTNYMQNKTDINGDKVLVVSRVKLRGEPSFGLTVDIEDTSWDIGKNVAEHYGAMKFIPPVKFSAGDAEVDHPLFPKYTDMENMRNFPYVFEDGEEVEASEKIHGTNVRLAFIAGDEGVPSDIVSPDMRPIEYLAGSRTLRRKDPGLASRASNTYWMPLTLDTVNSLLEALYANGHKQAVLYGEVFGKGVQSYDYGASKQDFRAFDLMIDGKYVDRDRFYELCNTYGVKTCPVLYRGPYSLENIKAVSDGASIVGGAHGREGVVVRPVKERNHPQVGRCILKYVGNNYLFSRHSEKDFTDQ